MTMINSDLRRVLRTCCRQFYINILLIFYHLIISLFTQPFDRQMTHLNFQSLQHVDVNRVSETHIQ